MTSVGGRWATLTGLVLILAACGGSTAASSVATTAPTPTTSGPVVPSGLTPGPTGSPEALDDGSTAAARTAAPLTLDAAAQAAAVSAGVRVMTLYARRTVPAAQWSADLAPLLTPGAAQAYAGTDPANVPPQKVTGPGQLTPASTPELARVAVPTDAGSYLVLLTRTADAPTTWLADRIVPPEG